MNKRHFMMALIAWAISWLLALGGGFMYAHVEHVTDGKGLYWAVTTVETVGYGDVTPHTNLGHYVAIGIMLLGIPMWGIAFGLFTSWLTSLHIWDSHEQMKTHVTGEVNK